MLTHPSTVTCSRSIARSARVGVEAFLHDRGAPEHRGRDVRRPQPEPERRGEGAEEHVVGGEATGGGRELVEEHPAVLVVHHALGQPGGARRGVHEEEIVGSERPGGERTGVEAPRLRLALAVGGHDHPA